MAVSFELAVWHSTTTISPDEAASTLGRWIEGDSTVEPHPAVLALHAEVVRLFPPLESLPRDEIDARGVWSMSPETSERLLLFSILWSRVDEVVPVVLRLAVQYGLICSDPQANVVNPNSPESARR